MKGRVWDIEAYKQGYLDGLDMKEFDVPVDDTRYRSYETGYARGWITAFMRAESDLTMGKLIE